VETDLLRFNLDGDKQRIVCDTGHLFEQLTDVQRFQQATPRPQQGEVQYHQEHLEMSDLAPSLSCQHIIDAGTNTHVQTQGHNTVLGPQIQRSCQPPYPA
jgi:hypothetical protein